MELIAIRGLMNNLLENYKDAIADFNRVIKLVSNDSSPYFLRADSYYHLKEYTKSKKDLIAAYKIENKGDFELDYLPEGFMKSNEIQNDDEIEHLRIILDNRKKIALLKYFPLVESFPLSKKTKAAK